MNTTYVILGPRRIARKAGSASCTHALIWKFIGDSDDQWRVWDLYRDRAAAFRTFSTIRVEDRFYRVCAAVLVEVDGRQIPGAIQERIEQTVGRLQANAARTLQRAAMVEEERGPKWQVLMRDVKRYSRWIDCVKAQARVK